MRNLRDRLVAEVGKVVVGQDEVVESLVAAVLVGGHVLLEGVPGVAKTLVANATARALGLDFRRVQFTPDMLPSDLTGTMVLTGGELAFRPGPVFANVLLADEINRTPPKTQAALLEAMQERQVTVDGVAHPAARPVPGDRRRRTRSSTRAPTRCPRRSSTASCCASTSAIRTASRRSRSSGCRCRACSRPASSTSTPVVDRAELLESRRIVDGTGVSDEVAEYVVSIIRATRELPSVELGASPRAAVHLLAAARAHARLDERGFVTPDDVVAVAAPVLRHRLLLRPEAELERYRPDDAVRAALDAVAVPR